MKKNINTALPNTWLSTVYLIVLSLVLLVSQLGFAKDRIQYHVQNFDGSTLKVINEQGVVSQSYQYAPFGQQLQLKKPSNLKNPRAFVGGIQDANDLVYLKQRHYNPVVGRFYQPDPITFISGGYGQTNRYQYGWNDSYTFKDSSGEIPLPIVTGAIGGVMGGGVSIFTQIYKNKGLTVNWREVGVATTVGAIAGAVSPWTATTTIGAIATGSTANVMQYGINQKLSNQMITQKDVIINAVSGAIGGGIGGSVVSKLKIPTANSPFISKSLANKINNNQLFYANVGDQTLYRNILANMASNDMFNWGSHINYNFLNNSQYGSYYKGNMGYDPELWTSGGLYLEISKP
ncbi:RHS repeat-associated core domain-containing protein, partial [Acinetobacter baumannii]